MTLKNLHKYFLIFCLLLVNSALDGMEIRRDSFQERLNNEKAEATPENPDRSRYNIALEIDNLALLQNQVDSFNERMEKSQIHVNFSQDDDYNVLFRFFGRLPDSDKYMQIHQVLMPCERRFLSPLNHSATSTQLKRRFEQELEDKVEKEYNSILIEAKNKYKKSYRLKFYSTIIPRALHKFAGTVASDITTNIISSLPFSIEKKINPSPASIEEVKTLIKKIKKAQSKLAVTEQLYTEIQIINKEVESIPPGPERDELQTKIDQQFCENFEQQVIN